MTGEFDAQSIVVCANCAATVVPADSKFCAQCGQSQRPLRLSFWRLIKDFVVASFELDGRLARTMTELLLRPGKLSQAFSDNRRASFVSPVRLYLFSSLLFFFLLALVGGDNLLEFDADEGLTLEVGGSSLEVGAAPASGSTDRDSAQTDSVGKEEPQPRANPERLLPYLDKQGKTRLAALLAEPYRQVNHRVIAALAEEFDEVAARDEEPGWWLRRSLANAMGLLSNPSGYYTSIVENLPIAMFVLLPFYALLLKLVFYSSRRYFSEHVVFALYLHVVAFLLFSVSIALPEAATGIWASLQPLVGLAAFGYLGVYTFLAMRNYYPVGALDRDVVRGTKGASEERRIQMAPVRSIGWRFLVLGACYVALLVPALLLVMAFSFIGL